ncbi:MAG TPA: alpha-glucosidase [Anaerolineales bacterium]|nr:alpha-glucosidase [Anaerolineales bacterium]
MTDDFLWWQDGVIYQIYPRSFADSDGDGLGDLPGIMARLDYLQELGVDAIWLSPFYPTPDKDFGYDISDYQDVDPRFGSLADFDRLVEEAHRRGIRLILDMVLNHTSDQHAWFQEARRSRDDARRDWYIWRDQPNNWQAAFGGPAWTLDPLTGQYYLHSFTKEQPDLNWRNPLVRQALLDVFRFWLERGADGFRLDVFNAYFKHPHLPDNPRKLGLRGFDRQHHIYDMDQPEMMPLLNELRHLLDTYPERYAVGETYMATPQKTVSYCGPDKLHAAFSFDFTSSNLLYPWNAVWVRQKIEGREDVFGAAGIWPTTVMSNHDLPRAASRYSRGAGDDAQAHMAMALLLTLRGTPFIYYGEEIGMRDIALKRSEILDPPGKKFWPFYKGRDGCRAPMQWDASAQAGFSTVQPWLPLHPDYPLRNVEAQRADPGSLFNFTKKLLALRKEMPALRRGDLVFLEDTPPSVLAYRRETAGEEVLVAINFGHSPASFRLPDGKWEVVLASGTPEPPGSLGPGQVCVMTN